MERGKMCEAITVSLLILLVLFTINAPVVVHAKTYLFTATISPAEVDVNQLATYLVNITNTGDSNLGSVSMAIPEGFTVLPPVTIVTPPSSWNYTLSASAISLTALSGGSSLNPGESLVFTFAAIAPASSGVTNWTVRATSGIGGGGVVLTLTGVQPTVTVISPFVAPTISASPGTIDQDQVSLVSQLTGASEGTEPYAYQWLEAFNGGAFSPIPGANGLNYTFSTTTSTPTGTWSFKVNVTDSSSVPLSVTSNTVNVVVNSALAAPEVTATPNAIAPTEVSNLTSLPVTTGTSPYTYQWFQKAPSSDYAVVGSNSSSYTFPGSTTVGTWTFLLQVTDDTGASVNSTAVDVTITTTPVFTITVTQTAHGTISPGTTSVALGGNQSFIISPDAGYQIVDVLVDRVSIGAATSFTFTDVNADHQLTASFAPIEFTLIVNVVGGGSVAKSPDQATYHYGDVVQLTAIPALGWRFSVWTDDLTGSANPSSITINGNNTVTATFLVEQFTITAVAGAGGSIEPPGTTIVDYGGSQAFIITPNAGHHIVNVLINGTSVGPVSSYVISDLTGDTTIAASFALDTLSIVASAGPNGSINPTGTVAVTYGSDQSFIISPDTGYHVADVLVDGVSVGAVTSYTFAAVVANHTIAADFAVSARYYFVSVVSSHGSPTSSAQVNAGDNFAVSVTSPEGDTSHRWVCTGYSIDSGTSVSGTSYTFTNVQANHTITFSWQEQYLLNVTTPVGATTGTGWYDVGTVATATIVNDMIMIDSGTRKVFAGWTGDASGLDATSNPVTMDGPKTATATWKTQYQVTYAVSGNVLQVTAPAAEWVDQGAQATGTFPTSVTNSAGDARSIFVSDDRPTAITQSTTVTGNYKTQFLVTFVQIGIASDASGTVVTVLGERKTYEQLPDSVWIDAGSLIVFSYVGTVGNAKKDKQYVLKRTNFSSPLTINEPTTIQGFYEPGVNPSGLPLTTIALVAMLVAVPSSVTVPLLARRNRRKPKRITPIANGGGSISPSTVQIIRRGGDSTVFIITKNPGYKIADVVIDKDVHLGEVRTYKFVNVTKDHTISAIFQKE